MVHRDISCISGETTSDSSISRPSINLSIALETRVENESSNLRVLVSRTRKHSILYFWTWYKPTRFCQVAKCPSLLFSFGQLSLFPSTITKNGILFVPFFFPHFL